LLSWSHNFHIFRDLTMLFVQEENVAWNNIRGWGDADHRPSL